MCAESRILIEYLKIVKINEYYGYFYTTCPD